MITVIEDFNLQDVKNGIHYLLQKSADSEIVRQHTLLVVRNHPDQIVAIYDWIKTEVRYVSDPANDELFTSPVKMIRDFNNHQPIGEDCDGMAILAVAMFRSVGIQANVVLLDTQGQGLDHAVAVVTSPKTGEKIMVDPSTSKYPLGWKEKSFAEVIV